MGEPLETKTSGTAVAPISIPVSSRIIAASNSATIRCGGSKARKRLGASAGRSTNNGSTSACGRGCANRSHHSRSNDGSTVLGFRR